MEARGLEYLIEHTIEQALQQGVVVSKECNPNIEQVCSVLLIPK